MGLSEKQETPDKSQAQNERLHVRERETPVLADLASGPVISNTVRTRVDIAHGCDAIKQGHIHSRAAELG